MKNGVQEQVHALLPTAIHTLATIAGDPEAPPVARVAAAKALLRAGGMDVGRTPPDGRDRFQELLDSLRRKPANENATTPAGIAESTAADIERETPILP